MFEKIVYISDHGAHVKINDTRTNMINQHLVFVDGEKQFVGEVEYVHDDIIEARFIGEIIDGKFRGGIISKPSLTSTIRLMEPNEMIMITGENQYGNMSIGNSPFYDNKPVYMSINSLFSNHLTILGNSGSGKSYGTTKLLQTLFQTPNFYPYKASFIMTVIAQLFYMISELIAVIAIIAKFRLFDLYSLNEVPVVPIIGIIIRNKNIFIRKVT